MKIGHKAILTIHGLPKYTKKEFNDLLKWLSKTHDSLAKSSNTNYSSRYTTRLMK
jgi:hypothetical protein